MQITLHTHAAQGYMLQIMGVRMDTIKTGRLEYVGEQKIGLYDTRSHYRCVDCQTEYPVMRGFISCNGCNIGLCPWCRPDSEPWKHGRGC